MYYVFIIENLTLFINRSIQPWSTLLENWTISQDERDNNSRMSRVMKFSDKSPVRIINSGMMATKREVSETDLYLLGMCIN